MAEIDKACRSATSPDPSPNEVVYIFFFFSVFFYFFFYMRRLPCAAAINDCVFSAICCQGF